MRTLRTVVLTAVLTVSVASSTFAQTSRLSAAEVARGSHSGAICATHKGRSDNATVTGGIDKIVKQACFPSVAACRNWLYWARTYFPRNQGGTRCS